MYLDQLPIKIVEIDLDPRSQTISISTTSHRKAGTVNNQYAGLIPAIAVPCKIVPSRYQRILKILILSYSWCWLYNIQLA